MSPKNKAISVVGVIVLLLGFVGLIRPYKTFDSDATYRVTTSINGRESSVKYESGSELTSGARIGALFMMSVGGVLLYGATKRLFD